MSAERLAATAMRAALQLSTPLLEPGTTSLLEPGATSCGTRVIPAAAPGLAVLIGTLEADRPCWVRFYRARLDAELDRDRVPELDPPAAGGVIAEFLFTPDRLAIAVDPVVVAAPGRQEGAPAVHFAIANHDRSAAVVTVRGMLVLVEA